MKLPKPRNLIIGIVIGVIIVGMGLVIAQDQETLRVKTSLSATDPRFPIICEAGGPRLSSGDRYTVLTDGDAAFPEMLPPSARRSTVSRSKAISTTARRTSRGSSPTPLSPPRNAASSAGWCSMRLARRSATMTPRGWRRPGVESAGSTRCVAAIEEVNYRTHRKGTDR